MARTRWTTEQFEALLAEARELGNWRGTPAEHALAALADAADWLLEESRAQRKGLRARLAEAVSSGEKNPERLRHLAALANRGPADEDEEVEPELAASVAALAERAAL